MSAREGEVNDLLKTDPEFRKRVQDEAWANLNRRLGGWDKYVDFPLKTGKSRLLTQECVTLLRKEMERVVSRSPIRRLCDKDIHEGGRSVSFHICNRPAIELVPVVVSLTSPKETTYEALCKIHCTAAVEKRCKKSNAKWERESAARERPYLQLDEVVKLLKRVVKYLGPALAYVEGSERREIIEDADAFLKRIRR